MSQTLLFHNARQVVTVDLAHMTPENPLGVIEEGAIIVEDGSITWVGETQNLPPNVAPDAKKIDFSGKILLPGLIDSHTHTVFAGDRAQEFEWRLQGRSYVDIAQAGGGIQKTVQATREASETELYELAKDRLMRMLSLGVTTVEIKSGYGLDWETELKCLRVIQRLQQTLPLRIHATYMGAHDIPPEYKDRPDAYVDLICQKQIPEVGKLGLAEFCDVFCETGYFSVEQSRKILETAKAHGLKLKIHAEEFNEIGGAVLAGELGCVSADHLLNISDTGIQTMKHGGTVATLLPGTAFYLKVPYAPARKILDAGLPVALATDFNPGSCMSENLQLMMTLGCLGMGMTPAEAIQGVTLNAARALACQESRGSLTVGKQADLTVWQTPGYAEILYHFGVNLVQEVYIRGQRVWPEGFSMSNPQEAPLSCA